MPVLQVLALRTSLEVLLERVAALEDVDGALVHSQVGCLAVVCSHVHPVYIEYFCKKLFELKSVK